MGTARFLRRVAREGRIPGASWRGVPAVAALFLAAGVLATLAAAGAAPPAGPEASREPAAQAVHGIDQAEVCAACHDLDDALAAPVPHAPVREGDCTACHDPHVSRFESLLRDRPAPLCAECHGDVAEELARPVVHAPAAEGRCAECHEPHGGEHAGLLVADGSDLCVRCHEEVASWRERPVRHVPFALGDCAECHEPHGGAAEGLLAETGGGACTSCHESGAELRARHQGYPVERAACQQCHDPHASARPGLLRRALHEPFESGDCSTCHPGPGAPEPFATLEAPDLLCAACHDEQAEAVREAPFPHVAAGGGGCVACHNPHTGDGAALLQADEASVCLSCHDPGGAASGQPGRFATHGGGLACTDCHDPHGGGRPHLLAAEPVELCAQCHTHEHGVSHPLGEEVRDPRNGDPMTCGSCHGVHDAPYELYLHRSNDHELCTSCHRDFAGDRR
ncbi:MAG: cytochrome c3 family protein [Thermoanaerobaculia bacterium]